MAGKLYIENMELPPQAKDWTGYKTGPITIIYPLGYYLKANGTKSHVIWKAKCDCGKDIEVLAHKMSRSGCSLDCPLYIEKKRKEQTGKTRGACPNAMKAALSNFFKGYKRDAAKRNYEFRLSFEVFKEIVKQDCYYCGAPPRERKANKKSQTFIYANGIDRKDNTTGYLIENSVPCCTTCNYMKSKLSHDEFIAHIERLAIHIKQTFIKV